MVLKLERHVATDNGRLQHGSGRWGRVNFDLHREYLPHTGRQTQLVEQPHEADERAVDDFPVIHLEIYRVSLCSELPPNCPQIRLKVILRPRSFQRKVQVLRVTGAAIQEA